MLEDAPIFLFGPTESFKRRLGLIYLIIHNFANKAPHGSHESRFCAKAEGFGFKEGQDAGVLFYRTQESSAIRAAKR